MAQGLTRVSTAKSAKSLKGADDGYDQLKQKYSLWDDGRKEFYMNAEKTKKKNHEVIEELKKENKDLKKTRDELLQNKRAVTAGAQSLHSRSGGIEVVTNDMKNEAFWKKRLDEQKNVFIEKKKELMALQDKLNEVTENKFGGVEESPLMRTIRILENRLDKVMIKYNEAQSIRKTYEQIVKRLKEERVGYDNQLAAIERSLKGKEHDFEELLLLAHDATHAKELAIAELKKYEHKKSAVKELRDAYLDEKKKAIQQKDEIIQNLERQARDNNEKTNDNKSGLDNSPEFNTFTGENQVDMNENKKHLKYYEDSFRQIYEATGVTDVNEIIQKFTTQDETTKSLNDLKQEYHERIEYLTNERDRIKKELNILKYEGGENMSRKQLDEIESNVNNVSNKCERARLKHERVSKILVNAKAGIEHLADKLDFYKLEGKANIPVTDDTLVESLSQCVEKLKIIYQVVKGDPLFHQEDNKRQKSAPGTTISSTFLRETSPPTTLTLYDKTTRPFVDRNIRVKDREDDEVSDGEVEDDIDTEVAGKLKDKYLNQLKNKENAKQKAKKK